MRSQSTVNKLKLSPVWCFYSHSKVDVNSEDEIDNENVEEEADESKAEDVDDDDDGIDFWYVQATQSKLFSHLKSDV